MHCHLFEVELEKVVGDGGSNEMEVKTVKVKYLTKYILSVLVSIGLSAQMLIAHSGM